MENRIIIFSIFVLIIISNVSGIIINDVDQSKIYPGEAGTLNIELKNNLKQDVEDISFIIDLSKLSFSTVGSSEKSINEIEEDEEENIEIIIKPAQDIKPGEYNLPYKLNYYLTDDSTSYLNNSQLIEKTGTIGITVGAKTELSYSVNTENSIIGSRGKINLKIINKGLGDTKFVNVKIIPDGFSLLSNEEIYIGTISSDDFETATFDVMFNNQKPYLNALVNYKDLENKEYQQNVKLPIKVYTREEALSLGLIKKNISWIYLIFLILIVLMYLIYKKFKKNKKKKQQEL
ncbi:MAG TPA: hypothetical protein P5277_03405 [Candidatus Paceibacterota bacterium]|nr:hypothetical protein [Candidatus Paceibacterota bacterium]